jgi:hypothetical protein
MAEGVAGRLRELGLVAGTVTVKVRDSGFRTVTRQRSLQPPTDLADPIWRAALELALPEVRGQRIRLVGVSASNLGAPQQLGLFPSDDPRQRRAVEAADALRQRFGPDAVTRGRLVGARIPHPFERDPSAPLARRRAAGSPAERGPDAPGRRPMPPSDADDSQGDIEAPEDLDTDA